MDRGLNLKSRTEKNPRILDFKEESFSELARGRRKV